MATSSYIPLSDESNITKSFLFWDFTDNKMSIQNGSDKIQTMIDENKSDEDIKNALATMDEAILALNPKGGKIGIGTKSPEYTVDVNGDLNVKGSFYTANFAVSSVIDSTVDPATQVDTFIKAMKYNKTVDGISTSPVMSWSMGLNNNGFVVKNNISSVNAISFTDKIIFGLPIEDLTVNNLTVNTKIEYKDIINQSSIDVDTLIVSVTGTITALGAETANITTGSVTTLTSENATIINLLTAKDITTTGVATIPSVSTTNGSIETLTSNKITTDELFIGTQQVTLDNMTSKFDAILDSFQTDICDVEDELYELNTPCLVSSKGSIVSTPTTYSEIVNDPLFMLWPNRNFIELLYKTELPIKTFTKKFSYEFYSKYEEIYSGSKETLINIQCRTKSNFDCMITYDPHEKKYTFRINDYSSNYIEIETDEIDTDIKNVDEWRHFKIAVDMDLGLYKFFVDDVEATIKTGTGTFDSFDIEETDLFYFSLGIGEYKDYTDLLFRPSYDITTTHFSSGIPYSSKNILIGKNCSFHLDSNGNFWAAKVWS